MKRATASFAFVLLFFSGWTTVHAQVPPADAVYLRVEAGDTYLNLFGRDWQRVWSANKIVVRRNGQFAVSPDILIAGSIIVVDPNVQLTPRAVSRIKELNSRREEGVRRMSELTEILGSRSDASAPLEELSRLLSSPERFAAESVAVDRMLTHLNALAKIRFSAPRAPDATESRRNTLLPATVLLLSVVGAGWLVLMRRRHKHGEAMAEERYAEATRAVDRAFNGL